MNSEKKTKLCKEYISQIKCFFPVIRQNEKKYINYISTSVNDYCIDNPDAAIEDLYNIFGSPQETINSYMSENPDNIVPYFKKINVKKWIIRILHPVQQELGLRRPAGPPVGRACLLHRCGKGAGMSIKDRKSVV